MTSLDLSRGRKSFSKSSKNFQTSWDSTSLGTFKTCPRKYELSILRGWQGRGSNVHLRFGILYHRALEVYDHKIFEGANHEEALRASLWDLREGCTEVLEDGKRAWWETGDTAKSVPNLFRTVIWYLDRFGPSDPCTTVKLDNGKPAVELSFRFEFGEVDDETLFWSGHLDRLVEFQDSIYFQDRKTTKQTLSQHYFEQFSPNNQMTGYTLAGRISFGLPARGGIIDAAQVAVGFSRFERSFTTRTDDQLGEWMEDTQRFISLAREYAERGYWPMNDMACGNYGGCQFRGICGKDPKVRDAYLRSNFDDSRAWDPLQTRGDI